ncbi:MAG: heavy metal-responsive transcriptional regulator [Candidatus Omnitrophica bacterium]|nr:heavy metal-responsive transcriptional regulator [Candidatus Omnitrophota bacterium]
MDDKNLFQIGEMTRKTGTSVDTVRYYEKLGLLDKPVRSDGGFRLYSDADIQKLRFIRKAQSLGFSLKEIKTIMKESWKGLGNCCGYVEKLIKGKLSELDAKFRELKTMRSDLQGMLRQWIPLAEARKRKFIVCPQIESKGQLKRGGKGNGKKKG